MATINIDLFQDHTWDQTSGGGTLFNGTLYFNYVNWAITNSNTYGGSPNAASATNNVADTWIIDFSGFAGYTANNLRFNNAWFNGDSLYQGDATNLDSFEVILPEDWTLRPIAAPRGYGGYYYHLFDANGDRIYSPSATVWFASAPTSIVNVCFVSGTKLLCDGDVWRAVEDLDEGDLVMTKDAGLQPLKWVGHSPVSAETLEQFPNRRPIVFEPGAIGNTERLRVSPQHRVLVTGAMDGGPEEERLVPAKHLVNDHNIYVDNSCEDLRYYHVMFDEHQVVMSENAWSESFWPGAYIRDAMDPLAWRQVEFIFPELARETDPLKAYSTPARPILKRREVEVFLNNRGSDSG